MKSRLVLPIALALSLALLLCSCALADNPFVSPRGSCNYIGGTTAIVTIFVDDPYHQWDWFKRSEDADSYFRVRRRLETAANWLMQQVSRYGVRANIIWDWDSGPYLYNWYTSEKDMRDYEYTYSELRKFITSSIQLERIKTNY